IALAAVAGAALWLAAPARARACSCTLPLPPEQAATRAAAVFEGRTYGVHREGNRVRYAFEVTRVWKGDVGAKVDIWTASHSAACGRGYDTGVAYIVYAHELPGGLLGDGLCSRTRPIANATDDLQVLGVAGGPATLTPLVSGDGPAIEPPRIETAPPPVASRRRGCAVDTWTDAPPALLALLALLARPLRRRRPRRSPRRHQAP
ncbi:MAG: hypothetical protein K1X88_33085, partial [Nannocystaceae bacterium]|nr:hypothetical protein [Nannocystaceae bacterium]